MEVDSNGIIERKENYGEWYHFRLNDESDDNLQTVIDWFSTHHEVHHACRELGKNNRKHIHATIRPLTNKKLTLSGMIQGFHKRFNRRYVGNASYSCKRINTTWEQNFQYICKGTALGIEHVQYYVSSHIISNVEDYTMGNLKYWETNTLYIENAKDTSNKKSGISFMCRVYDSYLLKYPADVEYIQNNSHFYRPCEEEMRGVKRRMYGHVKSMFGKLFKQLDDVILRRTLEGLINIVEQESSYAQKINNFNFENKFINF